MENKKMFTENEVDEVMKESNQNSNKLFMTVGGIAVGAFVAKKIYDKAIRPRIVNAMADMLREAQNQVNNENCKK